MYLYVLGFSKYPSLLKVGVSKSPLDRIRTLEKWHGDCVSSVFYNMGKTYHRAEKLIHVLLEDSNVCVDGDGGTEFFNSDVVFDTVEKVVELCGGKQEEMVKNIQIKENRHTFLDSFYDMLFNRPDIVSVIKSDKSIKVIKSTELSYDCLDIIHAYKWGRMPVIDGFVDSYLLRCVSHEDNTKEWYIEINTYNGMEEICGRFLTTSKIHSQLLDFYRKVEIL